MKIFWKRPDGGVSITHLTSDCELSAEKHAALLKARGDVPAGWDFVVGDVDVPADREFRDAWVFDGDLKVDMPKARSIHLGRIRAKRNAELDRLDKEQQRHRMNPNKVLEIEQEKVALRDLPKSLQPILEAAGSVEELRAIQPL